MTVNVVILLVSTSCCQHSDTFDLQEEDFWLLADFATVAMVLALGGLP